MARGGSRYGAGRPGWRIKAEHCLSLDVRRLAKAGLLRGAAAGWEWRDQGKGLGSIGIAESEGRLQLSYTVRGQHVETWVPILKTPCTYGGERPWFGCPACARRVAKLYLRASRFACRHCHRLTYVSRSLDVVGRSWRAQQRIENKLQPDGWKPAGMHWSTFDRLQERIKRCEEIRDAELARWLDVLLGARWRKR